MQQTEPTAIIQPLTDEQETENGQNSISNPTVDISHNVFEGSEPDIGCVLGLRFEKLDKTLSYDVFRNKFSNCIGSNIKYRNKLLCEVKEYKDPMTDYE